MFREYLNESNTFGKKEDNPLIYTLVIAKLAKTDKDKLKEDTEFKELLDIVEKLIEKVNAKALKNVYSPIALFTLFSQDSSKKALKDYVNQYYVEFENTIAGEEKSFANAWKIHAAFKELYESEPWKKFINNI